MESTDINWGFIFLSLKFHSSSWRCYVLISEVYPTLNMPFEPDNVFFAMGKVTLAGFCFVGLDDMSTDPRVPLSQEVAAIYWLIRM